MNLIFRDIYSQSKYFTFLYLLLNLDINIGKLIFLINEQHQGINIPKF